MQHLVNEGFVDQACSCVHLKETKQRRQNADCERGSLKRVWAKEREILLPVKDFAMRSPVSQPLIHHRASFPSDSVQEAIWLWKHANLVLLRAYGQLQNV